MIDKDVEFLKGVKFASSKDDYMAIDWGTDYLLVFTNFHRDVEISRVIFSPGLPFCTDNDVFLVDEAKMFWLCSESELVEAIKSSPLFEQFLKSSDLDWDELPGSCGLVLKEGYIDSGVFEQCDLTDTFGFFTDGWCVYIEEDDFLFLENGVKIFESFLDFKGGEHGAY